MNKPVSTNTTVRGDGQWAVVVLLLIVVLLPSATVLWLTSAAVRNERAAVREQLVGAYQRQLELAAAQINDHWAEVDRRCELLAENATAAELFEACVKAGIADSLLITGEVRCARLPVVWRTLDRREPERERLESCRPS